MRLRKSTAAVAIALAGLLFCAGNLWYTAQRSAIPVSLDDVVTGKGIGREKHPGVDDVHWLVLRDGDSMHVDEALYKAVSRDEHLRKDAWSRELRHDDRTLRLDWSTDTRGMVPTMAAGIGALMLLTAVARRSRRNRSRS